MKKYILLISAIIFSILEGILINIAFNYYAFIYFLCSPKFAIEGAVTCDATQVFANKDSRLILVLLILTSIIVPILFVIYSKETNKQFKKKLPMISSLEDNKVIYHSNNKKENLVNKRLYCVLAFVLGYVGGHKWYAKEYLIALTYLALFLIGIFIKDLEVVSYLAVYLSLIDIISIIRFPKDSKGKIVV